MAKKRQFTLEHGRKNKVLKMPIDSTGIKKSTNPGLMSIVQWEKSEKQKDGTELQYMGQSKHAIPYPEKKRENIYHLECPKLAKSIYSDTNESLKADKINFDFLQILFSSE